MAFPASHHTTAGMLKKSEPQGWNKVDQLTENKGLLT